MHANMMYGMFSGIAPTGHRALNTWDIDAGSVFLAPLANVALDMVKGASRGATEGQVSKKLNRGIVGGAVEMFEKALPHGQTLGSLFDEPKSATGALSTIFGEGEGMSVRDWKGDIVDSQKSNEALLDAVGLGRSLLPYGLDFEGGTNLTASQKSRFQRVIRSSEKRQMEKINKNLNVLIRNTANELKEDGVASEESIKPIVEMLPDIIKNFSDPKGKLKDINKRFSISSMPHGNLAKEYQRLPKNSSAKPLVAMELIRRRIEKGEISGNDGYLMLKQLQQQLKNINEMRGQ